MALIEAAPEIRAARLAVRGREGGAALLERLDREPAIGGALSADLVVVNDGAIEPAGEALLATLRGLSPAAGADPPCASP